MKIPKYIAFLLLASLYLTMACGITVSVVSEAMPCSGANAIDTGNGQSGEIPAKLTAQGQYIPLAKDIPCPSVHVGVTEFPPIADEHGVVVKSTCVRYSTAYFNSSSRDRAPPVA